MGRRNDLDVCDDDMQVALGESKKTKTVYQTNLVCVRDRLFLISQIYQLRKIIEASLRTLSPLENPEIAGQYKSEDLKEINVRLKDAAIDLKKMLEYFLSQATNKTDRNLLAV